MWSDFLGREMILDEELELGDVGLNNEAGAREGSQLQRRGDWGRQPRNGNFQSSN